ncbi:MAG TPA: replicative DNA helicase [bacterium]|nr:replicative DNA helicase [bacterium]
MPDGPVERVPPHSLEAEQSILGSMLLERDAVARVVEMVRPEDFYREAHRRVFEVVAELFDRGEPADLVSVTDRLRAKGILDDVGGAAYITSLLHAVPTAANVEYYARLVVNKSMLRQMIGAGTQIVTYGFREDQDVEVLVDQAEKLVFGIANRRMGQHFLPIAEVLRESFERIDRRYRDKGTVTGVPTGFAELDKLTSGLQPSDLVIVAARPSMGKCLKFDAEVVDASTGAVHTIQEMVAAQRSMLLSLNGDHRFRPTAPSLFVDDGIKPVFRVTTSGGRQVETTLTHPFLTPSGWEPLAALSQGALIAVPRRLAVFGYGDLPDHEVKLLAYLLSGRLPASPQIAEDFADAAAAAEAIIAGTTSWAAAGGAGGIGGGAEGGAAIAGLLWRYPELGLPPAARALPACVYTLRRDKLALFVNRLLGSAAEVSEHPDGYRVQVVCSSQPLARGVQHLLLRFGAPAVRAGTTLTLGVGAALALFRETGIFGWERLRRWARNAQRSLLDEVDVMWEEIATVEEIGAFQVYDLTVPETHNFVANDICVHNTTFALNIAQHAALQHKIPVAIFSLETNKEQLVQRMLCSEAQVDSSRLRSGYLTDADWPRLAMAMGQLSEAPIFIDDSATISGIEMRAKARKLQAEHGLGLIIIDYLQMIQSYKRAENRTQEVSEIARSTKSLAKELDVPVIAISQLSRVVEATGSRRPQLSHLRECVTADTVVWDADTGRRLTVGGLAGQESWPRLLSLDELGRLTAVRPVAVLEKGENDVFEVRTSTGRRLRATANHPVLTPEGWRTVDTLRPGGLIGAVRRLPVFHPGRPSLSSDRLRLLGYLIGDGSYQRHRGLLFISSDPQTFEDCIAVAQREFGVLARRGEANGTPEVDFASVYPNGSRSPRAYGRPHGNPMREWLRGLGVEGQSSYDKRVPDQVFVDADGEGLRSLLRAMFSADGCPTRRNYRNGTFLWSLHYDTVSWGLAEDVRDLLLRFGIVAQVSSGYTSKKATTPIYRVTIEDSRHLAAFCDIIGIEGRKDSLVGSCVTELRMRRSKPQVDRLPVAITDDLWARKRATGLSWRELGFRLQTSKSLDRPTAAALAEKLRDARVHQIATNDLLWDRVVSIVPVGREAVYDLVMPGTNNFVANGIVVHNSGELEQVSDLVLFIYREEYYDAAKARAEDKEHVAEIRVAKHRNGPVGDIEMFFHKEHGRFRDLDRRHASASGS